MTDAAPLTFQTSLLAAAAEPAIDRGFTAITRIELDDRAWIDHAAGWVSGSDEVFGRLREQAPWQHRVVPMYGRMVDEPRLTAWWRLGSGDPPFLPLIEDMRLALSQRYRVAFDFVLALLAGAAIDRLLRRARYKRSTPSAAAAAEN